jgi:hypothetical protein
MKTLAITTLLLLTQMICYGQRVSFGLSAEYTVANPQYGAVALCETKKQLGAGIFYQADIKAPSEGIEKNTFYGIFLQVPLATSDRLSLFGNARAGLVNERFAVVVPGLETRVNLNRHLALAFGMSLRMNYPSVSSKLVWKFF